MPLSPFDKKTAASMKTTATLIKFLLSRAWRSHYLDSPCLLAVMIPEMMSRI